MRKQFQLTCSDNSKLGLALNALLNARPTLGARMDGHGKREVTDFLIARYYPLALLQRPDADLHDPEIRAAVSDAIGFFKAQIEVLERLSGLSDSEHATASTRLTQPSSQHVGLSADNTLEPSVASTSDRPETRQGTKPDYSVTLFEGI